MSTDWTKAAEETKFEDKPKLEVGFSGPVTIVKTVREGREGEFATRNGEPQIMVVFASDDGGEKTEYYCLKGNRAFLFARLINASGLDVQQMEEDDISFTHFEENEFASAMLCNRRMNIDIVLNESKGKEYINVEVSPVEEAPLEELEADDGPIDDEAIPF